MIPNSYYKVLYLLAACQKYDMASIQSSIRILVKCEEFPAPNGAEAFTAYAIASAKRLVPEMENAARLTLDYPMTFEIVGEGLQLFEGSALRDLANFRKRDLVTRPEYPDVPFPRPASSDFEVTSPQPQSVFQVTPDEPRRGYWQ
jgi:hypothetical protein